MADKYIIHGATYNGDGTSSAEATSNGGVGAWNTITYFEGTAPAYGTLAAGDVVYIRSKDSGGSNITRTMTAAINLGSASATSGAWISWIIDNGTVWSGVDGTITYTHASTWMATVRQYNYVEAKTQSALIFANTSTNQAAGTTMVTNNGHLVNAKFDWSAKTGSGQCLAALMGDNAILESPYITWGAIGGAGSDQRGLIKGVGAGTYKFTVISPTILLTNSTAGMPLFYIGDSSARLLCEIIGGSVSGAGATSGQSLLCPSTSPAGRFRVTGMQFPRTMDVINSAYQGPTYISGAGGVEIVGCDGGIGGHLEKEWGYATSRTDSNPPVLQATLPDSLSTAWSWRVYPKNASKVYPMMLQSAKLYTGSAAIKTITQELLVADTMYPNARNLWITVEYTDDATGINKHLSTLDISAAALSSSSANWSATVWGAITLLKRKLEIATPTSVKQNTMIIVTLWGTLASASANDIYFVDPDFAVN